MTTVMKAHSLGNVHFLYGAGYATTSPLTLCVSHGGVGFWALNNLQALAVQWCREPGYHRKLETGAS